MKTQKPRSDSLHASLKTGQRDELIRLLADGAGYRDIIEWLKIECGVKTSLGALTTFYHKYVVPLLAERQTFAAMRADAIVADVGSVDWDAASLELIRRMTFKMLSSPDFDPETVEKFLKVQLKGRDQDLAARKLDAANKSKIDAGFEAVFAEIQGNARAEALFKQLQEVVTPS
ncbi:MAG: hypothetical protein WCK77_23190 [Verrucomicrobiota bacterium]